MRTRAKYLAATKFAHMVASEAAGAGYVPCAVCGTSFFQNIVTKVYCSDRCGHTAGDRRRRGEAIAGKQNRKITTAPKGKNYVSKYAPGWEE